MFAAVEVRPSESDHAAISVFFKHTDGAGLKFTCLEPFGKITIGLVSFLRFRTDCPNLEALVPLFQEASRGIIVPSGAGYAIHTRAAKGKVPITTMQSSKLPNYQKTYRGTSDKFWKRQFIQEG